MAEIRRLYKELDDFWREEISYVVRALKKLRVDQRNIERWNDFCSSLKQTIEFWKVCFSPLLLRIPNRSDTVSRTSHRAVIPKPYPAMTHPFLQFVYIAFHPFVSSD